MCKETLGLLVLDPFSNKTPLSQLDQETAKIGNRVGSMGGENGVNENFFLHFSPSYIYI